MCLIIQRNDSENIPESLLKDAYRSCHDGWGIMFADGGKVITIKGELFPELISEVERVQVEYPNKQFWVHLRMATQGEVSLDNTHPFAIGDTGICMMHNGTITNKTVQDLVKQSNNIKSDTAIFSEVVELYLTTRGNTKDLIFTSDFGNWVNSLVTSDRVVFLMPDGEYVVLGTGEWYNYSKTSSILVSNRYAWGNNYGYSKHYDYTNPNVWGWGNTYDDDADYLPNPSKVVRPQKTDSLTSEIFTGFDGYDDALLLDEEYTLDELMGMTFEELEEIGYRNPDILVAAIYAAGIKQHEQQRVRVR